MDADFEQHYQAAERAYGLGDYAEAHALASALWDQLESASDKHDPSLVLGWRAVVSLLLGHIQLHGLEQPEKAAISYERVLEGDVDATIAALAEQGLERCRTEDLTSKTDTTPASPGPGLGRAGLMPLGVDPTTLRRGHRPRCNRQGHRPVPRLGSAARNRRPRAGGHLPQL